MTQEGSRHAGTWRPMSDGRRREPSHAHHSTDGAQVQAVRAGATGRVCAAIEGHVLRKTVRRSLHFLRKPPGIAFDVRILEEARAAGVLAVLVVESEQAHIYTASLGDFERWGVPLNRGYGAQLALPLEHWQVRRPGDAVQLSLL